MIILLAMRNLLRSRRSSFLLIVLIGFITFIFFLGSSLIGQSVRGLQSTYVENLTGDLVVQRESRVSMNLFGANTPIIDNFFKIPTLPAYDEVRALVANDAGVALSAGMVSGQAMLDVLGIRDPVPLIGVDAETYFDLFPGITIEQGRFLLPGEEGIMVTSGRVKSIEVKSGQALDIGASLLLTSAGETGFKIREVPLVGIYTYTNPGPYMEEVVITDPQTVRALSSVLAEAMEPVEVGDDALELLDEDADDLFWGGSLFTEVSSEEESADIIDSLRNELTSDEPILDEPWLGGDWNFLIIRVNDGISPSRVQSRLNSQLRKYGSRAVGWQTAAGNSALMVLLIQALFYGGMLLVGFAGVVTIVNIILISVFKRTRELGTLRAIGASDGYIMTLLFLENFVLSLFGGGGGIVLGGCLINYINSLQWPIPYPLIAALMGSSILKVDYSGLLAFKSLILATGIGLIAVLFPGWKATRINPMEAVRRG